jgi:hypothetical protein
VNQLDHVAADSHQSETTSYIRTGREGEYATWEYNRVEKGVGVCGEGQQQVAEAQSAATCSRWFTARGFFYAEDGGDTFLRNVG